MGPAAFTRLYREEREFVKRALRRLGVRDSEVDDVAQELFLVALSKFHEFDRDRPVRPWLYAFALRFAANVRRRYLVQNRARALLAVTVVGPQNSLESIGTTQRVWSAIARIGQRTRPLFIAHEIEGETVVAYARRQGLPEETAHSRLRLARAEFRRAILVRERAGCGR